MAGTSVDMAATVWDLADGFAQLAHAVAPQASTEVAQNLYHISNRLRQRAVLLEREELATHLQTACHQLSLRFSD